jgi:Zn-dependent M28 family amino/carboxypeptidase
MVRAVVVLAILVAVGSGCGSPGPSDREVGLPLPAGWERAADTIVPSDLLVDVTALSSDEMEGRLPGSRGDRLARAYLAERLQTAGFEPLFGGEWEQRVEIVGVTSRMPGSWVFAAPTGVEASFAFGTDYMGASGRQEPVVEVADAEVVFVGYGIVAPEEGWDDFKGADLEGKVLLMLNDDPDWDPELFAGERKLFYGRWTYKYESAARQGAVGAIIVHTTPSAGYPWEVVCASWRGEQFELPAGDEPRLAVRAWLTEDAARRLVALAGRELDDLVAAARSREFRPIPLGTTTSIGIEAEVRSTETANVGGILRGSDPERAGEVVVYSAHHDHFGVGEPDESGDAIYNGALDNGVAMAQALAMARAFAALPQPPRRSVAVVFVAAEEQGLLGSSYFANSGAIHPGLMVANVNFEMGNVWGRTRDVTVYGRGKSDLEELLAVAAAAQGRVLTAETDVHAGWFYRSDQFSFARVGVPAIWFKSGVDFIGRPPGWGEARYAEWIDRHYHRPSDEVEPGWVLDGLAEDARLAFMLGAAVATRDAAPAWVGGDEFEDERLEALRDLAASGR